MKLQNAFWVITFEIWQEWLCLKPSESGSDYFWIQYEESEEAPNENFESRFQWWKLNENLQGGEDKKDSQVNLDNQVGELVSKDLSDQTVR